MTSTDPSHNSHSRLRFMDLDSAPLAKMLSLPSRGISSQLVCTPHYVLHVACILWVAYCALHHTADQLSGVPVSQVLSAWSPVWLSSSASSGCALSPVSPVTTTSRASTMTRYALEAPSPASLVLLLFCLFLSYSTHSVYHHSHA